MTDDSIKAEGLTDEQLGHAFRDLADEYSLEGDAKNDETWAKIQALTASGPAVRLVPREQPSGSPVRFALAAAAACLLSVWGVWALRADDLLGYTVNGGDPQAVAAAGDGDLIAAEDEPVVVTFSDATRLTLAPHSTLRFSTNASRSTLTARLAQGRAEVEIGPHPETELEVRAGTYTLKPLGATFAFGYVPGADQLDVTAMRGVVLVRDASGSEYRVAPGEAFKLPQQEQQDTSKGEVVANLEGEPSMPGASPGSRAPGAAPTEPTFQALAAAGKFSEIVRLAKRRGLDGLLASGSATDLQELGQAARYTGDLALASRTWTTMTQRFSGASGQNARFFLGRLAEQQGNAAAALQHYDAYLTGAGGVYTAEALGRKLSIVKKSQGAQKARPIAQEYLRRFPQGPFARAARELVGGE